MKYIIITLILLSLFIGCKKNGKLPPITEEGKKDDKMWAKKSDFYPPIPIASGKISSGFGWRTNRFHYGIDIVADEGTEIRASLDGTAHLGYEKDGCGIYLKIDHHNGLKTQYCHCERILVQEGQRVKRGEVIALVGTTGNAKSPHLHYAVLKNDQFVDPLTYIELVDMYGWLEGWSPEEKTVIAKKDETIKSENEKIRKQETKKESQSDSTKTAESKNKYEETNKATNDSASNLNNSSSQTINKASNPQYTVQVGSFTNKDNAIRLKLSLEKQNYNVRIVEANINGKTFFRVQIGSFETIESAKEIMEKLKTEENLPAIIVKVGNW